MKRLLTWKHLKWLIAYGLAGLALVGSYLSFHWQRWRFEAKVRPGMSQAAVRQAVGPPAGILAEGRVLDRWGNERARQVGGETWVYHVSPPLVHRHVLTFAGDELVSVEYHGN